MLLKSLEFLVRDRPRALGTPARPPLFGIEPAMLADGESRETEEVGELLGGILPFQKPRVSMTWNVARAVSMRLSRAVMSVSIVQLFVPQLNLGSSGCPTMSASTCWLTPGTPASLRICRHSATS
jgi:hypothetical protein